MRFAGQAKAGYYPTPDNVVQHIERILRFTSGARAIDTCCGEGRALAIVTEGKTDVRTYGVELDPGRAETATKVIQEVMCCDAIEEARISHKAFGLLWLNPPYDWAAGDTEQEKERIEVRFFRNHHFYLQDGGILVYIIPFASIRKVQGIMSNRLENVRVFPFNEEDYQDYKQAVVIGVYRTNYVSEDVKAKNREYFEEVLSVPVDQAPYKLPVVGSKEFRSSVYTVPAKKVLDKDLIFRSLRFDPGQAHRLIQKDGLYDRFLLAVKPKDLKSIRPLIPPRQGHTALMLAAGLMNGEVQKDGRSVIVKGMVRKVAEVTEVSVTEKDDGDMTTIKETEKYVITVRMLDLQKGKILDIR